jgi:hypothetical protein
VGWFDFLKPKPKPAEERGTIAVTPEEAGRLEGSGVSAPTTTITETDITRVADTTAQKSGGGGGGSSSSNKIGFQQPNAVVKTQVTEEQPIIQERGTLSVTPEEAGRLQTSEKASYVKITSTAPQEVIQEAKFKSNIPVSTARTEGAYKFTRENIAGREALYTDYKIITQQVAQDPLKYKGEKGFVIDEKAGTYQLTPEFYESKIDFAGIQKGASAKAKSQFQNLPVETQRKLRFGETITSASRVGVAGAEFISIDVPYKFLTGYNYQAKDSKVYTALSTRLASIPSANSVATYSGAVAGVGATFGTGAGQLIKHAKTFGVRSAIIEAGGAFAPLRPTPSISSAFGAKTRYKVISFKETKPTGEIVRYNYGTGRAGEGINLRGVEVFKPLKSGGYKFTSYNVAEAPAIKYIGGEFSAGTRVVSYKSTGKIIGTGKGTIPKTSGVQLEGGVVGQKTTILKDVYIPSPAYPKGTGYTFTKAGTGYSSTIGAVSKQINPRRVNYLSGEAEGVSKFKIGKDYWIAEPSGKYKMKPTTIVKEFDITPPSSLGGSKITRISEGVTTRGGGRPKVRTPKSQTIKIKAETLPTTTQPPKSTQVIKTRSITSSSQKSGLMSANVLAQFAGAVQRGRSRLTFSPALPSRTTGKLKTGTGTGLITSSGTGQTNIQRQSSRGVFGGSGGGGYNFPTPSIPKTNIPIAPIALGLGGFSAKSSSKVFKGGKKRVKYTPSFSALAFKIYGEAPKGSAKTGLGFRPITPDFSFEKAKFNILKRRKLKL